MTEQDKKAIQILESSNKILEDKLRILKKENRKLKEQLRLGGVGSSFCELFVPREKENSYCAKCEQHKIDH